MEAGWFWRGVILGLAVAVPVGPIGLLCIQRSLVFGSRTGFVTGLGAATADAAYAAVAAFGLTAISSIMVAGQNGLRAAGALCLIYLGLKTLIPHGDSIGQRGAPMNAASNYLSTVVLTLANPATILSFLAMFSSAIPQAAGANFNIAAQFTAGVFAGSASWWLVLSNGVGVLRARVGPKFVRVTNVLSGATLLGFAVYAITRTV